MASMLLADNCGDTQLCKLDLKVTYKVTQLIKLTFINLPISAIAIAMEEQ